MAVETFSELYMSVQILSNLIDEALQIQEATANEIEVSENEVDQYFNRVAEQNFRRPVAETEKYPHVTFFFSGGREHPFEQETRLMIPSPKVATYDLQPEMSAQEVADTLCKELEERPADFVCLNFANCDMVGHTGDFNAVVKAVETTDHCVEQVVACGLKNGYSFLITADHGNADYEINEDGSPNTAHTLNPVPLFVIDKNWKGKLKSGKLGDIAPTILNMMDLPIPQEINGNILTAE